MLRKVLVLSLITYLLTTVCIDSTYTNNYRTNSSKNLYSVIVSVLENVGATCKRSALCRLAEKLKTSEVSYSSPRFIGSSDFPKKASDTAVEARSYYGAYYPAFDPISILASLAFLAFLLQSLAALYDRSRSVIPAIVTSRDSPQYEPPDLVRLILRALDEYEVLDNAIGTDDYKITDKLM